MTRKLASLRKISDIQPIKDADRIELVTVDGWKVVSQKGIHKVGDIVVYIEIDSFVPVEVATFLTQKGQEPKEYFGVIGNRLRSLTLRGQISQGLILPLSELNKYGHYFTSFIPPNMWVKRIGCLLDNTPTGRVYDEIGADCTEYLGIIKYEPPPCLEGVAKGYFPEHLMPKTDEERIQNLVDIFDELKKELYFVSEKLDGASTTFYVKDGEFGVCSKNLELLDTPESTQWIIVHAYRIDDKLKSLNRNIAVCVELVGEGIQKNKYKLKGRDVYMFYAFDIDKREYLSQEELIELSVFLGVKMVPQIIEGWDISSETVESLINFADAKSCLNGDVFREGLVFRTNNREKSFKIISNAFLIKHGE